MLAYLYYIVIWELTLTTQLKFYLASIYYIFFSIEENAFWFQLGTMGPLLFQGLSRLGFLL